MRVKKNFLWVMDYKIWEISELFFSFNYFKPNVFFFFGETFIVLKNYFKYVFLTITKNLEKCKFVCLSLIWITELLKVMTPRNCSINVFFSCTKIFLYCWGKKDTCINDIVETVIDNSWPIVCNWLIFIFWKIVHQWTQLLSYK